MSAEALRTKSSAFFDLRTQKRNHTTKYTPRGHEDFDYKSHLRDTLLSIAFIHFCGLVPRSSRTPELQPSSSRLTILDLELRSSNFAVSYLGPHAFLHFTHRVGYYAYTIISASFFNLILFFTIAYTNRSSPL